VSSKNESCRGDFFFPLAFGGLIPPPRSKSIPAGIRLKEEREKTEEEDDDEEAEEEIDAEDDDDEADRMKEGAEDEVDDETLQTCASLTINAKRSFDDFLTKL